MLLLLAASTTASADFRITTLTKSWHFSDKPYNENHHGFGIEARISGNKDHGLYLGITKLENSFYQRSTMVSLIGEYRIKQSDFYWGPFFAVADGYAIRRGGRVIGNDYAYLGGVVTRYKYFRLTVTPVLIAAGLVWEIK